MRSSRELHLLGTGSILPHAERSPAGYALCAEDGRCAWLDAGPGTLARFGRTGLDLAALDHVFLTHFHPDHCLDVAALLFARRNPAFEHVPPLTIVGPRGTKALVRNLQGVWGGWVRDESVQIHEIGPDGRYATAAYRVQAAPTHHTDHALCYRLTFDDGFVLTYSGDSDDVPELERNAAGADLFLCECSFPDAEYVAGHLTPRAAGALAARADVEHLVLTHFYPSLDPEQAVRAARHAFAGEITAARDGARIVLPSRSPSA